MPGRSTETGIFEQHDSRTVILELLYQYSFRSLQLFRFETSPPCLKKKIHSQGPPGSRAVQLLNELVRIGLYPDIFKESSEGKRAALFGILQIGAYIIYPYRLREEVRFRQPDGTG